MDNINFKNNHVSLLKSCEFHENLCKFVGKDAKKVYLFSTVFITKFKRGASFMKFDAEKDLFQ